MSGTKSAARATLKRQKVPAFARYQGTSAWRRHRRRVREYAWYRAREEAAARAQG